MSDRVKSYLNRLGPGARLISNSRTPSPHTCSSLVVHPMSSVPSSCPPTPAISGSASENGSILPLSRSSDVERATLPLTTAISSANSAVGESGSQPVSMAVFASSRPSSVISHDTVGRGVPPLSVPSNMVDRGAVLPSASYPPATPSGDTVNGSWPPPPTATPSGDTLVGPVSLSVPSNMVNRGAVLPSASYPSSVILDVTVGGSWPPHPPAVPSGIRWGGCFAGCSQSQLRASSVISMLRCAWFASTLCSFSEHGG